MLFPAERAEPRGGAMTHYLYMLKDNDIMLFLILEYV